MSQHSDQGAGAAAIPPAAPVADGGAITAGGILSAACILVLFVILALGLSSLQYFLDYVDAPPSWRRRGGVAVGNDDGATRGVDPEFLRSLPVTVYRAAAKGSSAGCAVCLAELEDGEEARFLPRCGHGFHVECVDTWLASHTTCPLCRLTVAKPDDTPPPPSALARALRPVLPEPANYYASDLHASALLGVSDNHQSAANAAAYSTDRAATATLVIEIPESAAPTTCDAAKSPGSASARLRSIRRLWSFGRQGAGSSSSCSCADDSERTDVEQGIGFTIGIAVAETRLLPSDTAAGATPGAAA